MIKKINGRKKDKYFVYDGVPTIVGVFADYTDPVTRILRRQKFDHLILKAKFRIYVVIEYDDGAILPLGNTHWDLDGLLEAELNGTAPDSRNLKIKKKTMNTDPEFKKSDERPAKMNPPKCN